MKCIACGSAALIEGTVRDNNSSSWPGDVLVAIDNKLATSFSLEEINSLFRQEGREYLLTFKRGGKVFKAKIKNISLI